MRFAAPRRFVCNRRCRASGSPALRRACGVSTCASGLFRLPYTDSFGIGTSSHELHVLFRVHAFRTRPGPGVQSNFLGVLPLFATSTSSVHTHAGFPARTVFRPRRLSRPRRFAPPPALQVYFTPQPRPGFALQGILPPTLPYGLVVRRFPRAVRPARLRTRLPVTAPANLPPTSGLSSAPESPVSTTVLPAAGPRPLLGFSSCGFSFCSP
jgi:hypothetical protein